MIIRNAKQEDLPQVLALIRFSILHMDDKGIEQWPDWYPNKDDFEKDITKNQLFVSEENNIITGLVTLSPELPKEYSNVKWKNTHKNVTSIHRLAVHPTLKTPDLAIKLILYVEKRARKDGYQLIRLDTYSKNTIAKRFYQKLAYQFCGDINLRFMPEKYHCYEKVL